MDNGEELINDITSERLEGVTFEKDSEGNVVCVLLCTYCGETIEITPSNYNYGPHVLYVEKR